MDGEVHEPGAGGSIAAAIPAQAATPFAALKRHLTAFSESAAVFSSGDGIKDAAAQAQRDSFIGLSRVEKSIQDHTNRQRQVSKQLNDLERERRKLEALQHTYAEKMTTLLAEKQRWQRSIEDNRKEQSDLVRLAHLAQTQIRILQTFFESESTDASAAHGQAVLPRVAPEDLQQSNPASALDGNIVSTVSGRTKQVDQDQLAVPSGSHTASSSLGLEEHNGDAHVTGCPTGAAMANDIASDTQLRKRPAQDDSTPVQIKRPRSTKHRDIVVTRTITFEEVCREAIDRIAPYPPGSQNFYIFRCVKHPALRFQKGRPVHGAARHLASQAHINGTKYHWHAVQELGVRVTHCDAAKVDAHNRSLRILPRTSLKTSLDKATSLPQAVDDHHLSDGDEDNTELIDTDSESEGERTETITCPDDGTLTSNQGGGEDIFEPLVGEVCIADWSKADGGSPRLYAAVRLALGRLTALALRGSIVDTDLLAPKYFAQSIQDRYVMKDDQPTGWSRDYKSGGRFVFDRHYPFLFLEPGLDFKPSGALHIADLVEGQEVLDWVHQDDIKPLDPRDPDFHQLAQQSTMRHYLERLRNIRGLGEAAEEQLRAIYDAVGEPTSRLTMQIRDMQSFVGCSHTPVQPSQSERGSHPSAGDQLEARAASSSFIDFNEQRDESSNQATNESHPSHSVATQLSLKSNLSGHDTRGDDEERGFSSSTARRQAYEPDVPQRLT